MHENIIFWKVSLFSSPVLQFPMISEFGEERILCCSCEPAIKDTSVIQSETTNLQQRINSLSQEVHCNIISIVLIKVIVDIWEHGNIAEVEATFSSSQTVRHKADSQTIENTFS